jgi:ABC-2 type transport system ATP-binding protein
MSSVVEIQQLTKVYGNIAAINNISFSVEEGKIYGLLGRNGAGKTTLMQIIAAQIFATCGELRVFGETPYENSHVLRQLCFIRESQKYPDHFRVADVLDLCTSLFPFWDREYALALVKDFRLPLKQWVKKLSRGMLSSVGIVIGLACRAPLTIFDEPYLGLDAVARSIFYDRLLEDYSRFPRTIILSTHLIDEVSRLLEHVIVIDNGEVIIDEEADTLRERAFTIIGSAPRVETFTAGREVLSRELLGSLVSATVLGSHNAEDQEQARELGLELAPVSLQQLIVHLTGKKPARKAVLA